MKTRGIFFGPPATVKESASSVDLPSNRAPRAKRVSLLVPLLAAFLLLPSCVLDSGPTDIWVGRIITMDASLPGAGGPAEALAVRGGELVAVGGRDEVLELATSRTRIHELGDRVLMPGFVAAHEHPSLTAVFSGMVDLSAFTNDGPDEAWAALEGAVAKAKPGEWIYGMGIDYALMPGLGTIDRDRLDRIAPENPVVLIAQSIHSFWVNGLALAEKGIGDYDPDPAAGGHYGRDETGRLNGFIAEPAAAAPFTAPLRKPLRMVGAIRRELEDLSGRGFTTVASLGYNAPPWLLRLVSRQGFKPFIRQAVYLMTDELSYLPPKPDNGDAFFRVAGIKLWHDGSPYTGTMLLKLPYLHNELTELMGIAEGQTGEELIPPEELEALIRKYSSEGWQLAIHSQGDASNGRVLDALERSGAVSPDSRTRLEHSVLLPAEEMDRLAELGISPSFHINHVYYYGDALADGIIGAERASRLLPVREAFELGLRPTLHADSPMFPPDPFSLMRTAITRESRSGRRFNPEQAISPVEALEAMTINAARQLRMEDTVGSLETGKRADFILLSDDPLSVDPHDWTDIAVEETWIEGRRVSFE